MLTSLLSALEKLLCGDKPFTGRQKILSTTKDYWSLFLRDTNHKICFLTDRFLGCDVDTCLFSISVLNCCLVFLLLNEPRNVQERWVSAFSFGQDDFQISIRGNKSISKCY